MTSLTVHIMGGLGNQLFQLAALHHIATKTGRTPFIHNLSNPSTHSTLSYFDRIFKNFRSLYSSMRPTARLSEPSIVYSNWSHVNREQTPELFGYFQDWRYVDQDFVQKLWFPPNMYDVEDGIFLHIRGGDYVGNAFHDVGLDGYYERAIALFPGAHFFVVTNDVEYAKSRPYLKDISYTLVTEPEIETLLLMSQCAGGICANSSFSWWGAYLNKNRKIVMPDRWYTDSSIPTEGYYFPGVIKCQV